MKTAVIYRSMTGHSKKIAKAIAAELGIEAQNIKAKPILSDVDLLFIAGGIYSGESLPELADYLNTLTLQSVKKAALITSSVTGKQQNTVRKILTERGIEVIDEFCCKGNFLFLKLGHPNKSEILAAVDFAKQLAKG